MTKETIGLDRISPSGLHLYETCPKAFYYSVWLGLKLPQDMRHMNFGTAVHAGIGNIYDQFDKDQKWELAEFKHVKSSFDRL